jgi:adenylate cyclase
MQERVASWCREEGIEPPLILKLGVHAGPVIAMTANDRLDYFGRTVNVAARLGEQSRGQDVVLMREVFDRVPTLDATSAPAVESFTTPLRGLESDSELVRLTVDQKPAVDRGARPQVEHVT